MYSEGKLSEERMSLLESIGFKWQLRDDWVEMYQRLVSFKKKHGTTCVPYAWKEDPKLANWVPTQRSTRKEEDRIDLLNYIGFDWNPLQAAWMEMYGRLLSFKKKHGTTCVPWAWKEDPKLANCKEKDRIDLLNDIDFVWDVRDMYQR